MRRWEELRSELDARGVQLVTVSPETPDQIKKGHAKHSLGATMLADLDLQVTDLFGLRNLGVHSGPPVGGAKALPVPTSILANADGRVVWIDQSENYQRRSDPDYVLAALRQHLGQHLDQNLGRHLD